MQLRNRWKIILFALLPLVTSWFAFVVFLPSDFNRWQVLVDSQNAPESPGQWGHAFRGILMLSTTAVVLVGLWVYLLRSTRPVLSLCEVAQRLADGDLNARATCVGSDEVAQLAASLNDMAQKLAEREYKIKQTQERFRTLVEVTSDWIWEVDHRGIYVYVSPKVRDILGYEPEEVIGRTPFDFMPPEEAIQIREKFEQAVAKAEPLVALVNTAIHRSGRHVHLETNGVPIQDDQGRVLGYRGVDRDITTRLDAEDALRESEAKCRGFFENASDGILMADPQSRRLLMANPAICDLLGYSAEELLTMTVDCLHPNSAKEQVLQIFTNLAHGERTSAEDIPFLKKNGETVYLNVSAFAVEVRGRQYIAGFFRDISEQKKFESDREKLIAELEAQNSELERFTYTVSHDLRTPLITIKGYAGLLQKDQDEGNPEAVVDDLTRIRNAADKMDQLLADLLELSRIGRLANPPRPVAMSQLAQDTIEMSRSELEERGVRIVAQSDMPTVLADRTRLSEVLQNLVDNAVKYMGDQPNPEIEIGVRKNDSETVFFVRDNGIGIDSADQDRVFGLFDQLDKHSEGSGIGLALVKRIIEVHGGRVWVESEGIGHGSAICFTLPLDSVPEASDSQD